MNLPIGSGLPEMRLMGGVVRICRDVAFGGGHLWLKMGRSHLSGLKSRIDASVLSLRE